MSQSESAPVVRKVAIVGPTLRDPSEIYRVRIFFLLAPVLAPLAEDVFIISGNFFENIPCDNVRVINVKAPLMESSSRNLFSRGLQYFFTQLALSHALIRLSRKTANAMDVVFVITGGPIPMTVIFSKLLRKTTILTMRGSIFRGSLGIEEEVRKEVFRGPSLFLRRINLALSDRVLVYSDGVIKQWNLEKYRNKVLVAPYLFLDLDKFRVEKQLSERNNIVGHIGRLSPVKGVTNFVEAMPKLVEASPDVRFLMVGGGELQDRTEQYVKELSLDDKVRFVGRVNHDEIPGYLNQLRLLVVPSYSEGLPNAVLEAMACGTPVLATPAGSIPDVITDGETGFIMENNSPECIAKNVARALNHPDLEKIARNARTLVEKEFTYQASVERYRDILASLNRKR